MLGEGLDKRELQWKRDGRGVPLGTTSRFDRQHRTTSSALNDVRSSYKPAILMDSAFFVDSISDVLREKTGHLWGEIARPELKGLTAVVY